MRNKIKTLLLRLGIDPALKGYSYLVDAIDVCYKDNSYSTEMMKKLYPYVAQKNNTMPSRAERAMRHAIQKACSCSIDIQSKLIFCASHETGSYTNTQFICACVEKLKMEEEK